MKVAPRGDIHAGVGILELPRVRIHLVVLEVGGVGPSGAAVRGRLVFGVCEKEDDAMKKGGGGQRGPSQGHEQIMCILVPAGRQSSTGFASGGGKFTHNVSVDRVVHHSDSDEVVVLRLDSVLLVALWANSDEVVLDVH